MRTRIVMLFLACMVSAALSMPLGAQTAPAATTTDTTAKPAEAAPAPAPAKPAEKIKLMIYDGEKAKVQFYGFIKLDMAYNTTGVVHEAGPMAVDNLSTKTAKQRDGSLTAEARNTRLGFLFTMPEALGAKLTGCVETDFWGQMPTNAAASNQTMIRLRHAYMKLDWPTKTYLLIGQYWSTAMAYEVMPTMATFVPMGKCGLLFQREQQVTVGQKLGDKMLTAGLDLSASRVQAGNDINTNTMYTGPYDSQVDERGAGESSCIPGFRGKLSLKSAPIDGLSIFGGISGFYQIEKQPCKAYDHDSSGSTADVATDSDNMAAYAGIGFLSVMYQMVGVSGHFFYGANTDGLTGIAGTNATSSSNVDGVKTMGGWGQLTFDLRKLPGISIPVSINGGYGVEDVKEAKAATGAVIKNECAFGNVYFYANQYLTFMAEVARMETAYKGASSYDDWRYHLAAQMTF